MLLLNFTLRIILLATYCSLRKELPQWLFSKALITWNKQMSVKKYSVRISNFPEVFIKVNSKNLCDVKVCSR